MTDRELLEFAAKAAGHQIEGEADKLVVFPGHFSGGFSIFNDVGGSSLWNPLTDDGDALRLAVKLKIGVIQWSDSVSATHAITNREYSELYGSDPHAATRRAIVRAAAAIGKEMQ